MTLVLVINLFLSLKLLAMDDFILFLSCGPFPPETKSSLGGKRHTARIQAVSDEPNEELRQGKSEGRERLSVALLSPEHGTVRREGGGLHRGLC